MRLTHKDRKAIMIIAGALLLLNVGVWICRPRSPLPLKGENVRQGTTPTPSSTREKTGTELAEPFPFDPNTADSATFAKLGLKPKVIQNILHYREANLRFYKPQDFARIYTLSDKDFRRLLPYIYIKGQQTTKPLHQSTYHYEGGALSEEGVQKNAPFPSKLHPGQTLDINAADTTELRKIPGVGQYYAAKIVKYRSRLGGFTSTAQLREIKGLPDDIGRWVTIGKEPVSKLAVNQLTFGQLLRHPYLNFEQVRAIMDHRKHTGPIHSLGDLRTYPAFSDSDFRRLQPYIAFE